jgi:ribosome-binding factor A
MKRTPTLTFHYDDTIEQGARVFELLEEGPAADPEESR